MKAILVLLGVIIFSINAHANETSFFRPNTFQINKGPGILPSGILYNGSSFDVVPTIIFHKGVSANVEENNDTIGVSDKIEFKDAVEVKYNVMDFTQIKALSIDTLSIDNQSHKENGNPDRVNLKFTGPFNLMPKGIILMVDKSKVSEILLAGSGRWAVCDGTNGTPNLVDKFIFSYSDTNDIKKIEPDGSIADANSSAEFKYAQFPLGATNNGDDVFRMDPSTDIFMKSIGSVSDTVRSEPAANKSYPSYDSWGAGSFETDHGCSKDFSDVRQIDADDHTHRFSINHGHSALTVSKSGTADQINAQKIKYWRGFVYVMKIQ